MSDKNGIAVMAIWRDDDKTVVQAWDELTVTTDLVDDSSPFTWPFTPKCRMRLEGINPRSLMVKADSQADATARIFEALTRRATEAEAKLKGTETLFTEREVRDREARAWEEGFAEGKYSRPVNPYREEDQA